MHIGAQPVPPSLIKHWKEYFPTMAYDTNYGLSESTGPGCVHLGMENEHKIGAIGLPGFNWETQIVDPEGTPGPRRQGRRTGCAGGRGDAGILQEPRGNRRCPEKWMALYRRHGPSG